MGLTSSSIAEKAELQELQAGKWKSSKANPLRGSLGRQKGNSMWNFLFGSPVILISQRVMTYSFVFEIGFSLQKIQNFSMGLCINQLRNFEDILYKNVLNI